jgi:hypothetical protein
MKTIFGFLTFMPGPSKINFIAIFDRSREVGVIEKIYGNLDGSDNWEGRELTKVGIRSKWIWGSRAKAVSVE